MKKSDKWNVHCCILEATNNIRCAIISSSINISETNGNVFTPRDSSYLDSHHANIMCELFQKYCYIISLSIKFCDVSSFLDGIDKLLKVSVVDTIISHNYHITYQCYILIARNV